MCPPFKYQWIKSTRRRKTISLHIKKGQGIVIYTPHYTPRKEIERFLGEKQSWIIKHLKEKERQEKEIEKKFLPGEKFLYLGEWFPLKIDETNHSGPALKLSYGFFILNGNRMEKARDLFIQWYRKEAKEKISDRVDYYSSRLGLFPEGIKITSGRSRWGSCSRDNRLSFSWRLMMAPLAVIDYVLIHELAHIREKNHSRNFWAYLESILPGYKTKRLWLKKNGHLLQM